MVNILCGIFLLSIPLSAATFVWDPRTQWGTTGASITTSTVTVGPVLVTVSNLPGTNNSRRAASGPNAVNFQAATHSPANALDTTSIQISFSEAVDFALDFSNINIPDNGGTGAPAAAGEWIELGVAPSSVVSSGSHFYAAGPVGSARPSSVRIGTTGNNTSDTSRATWSNVTSISFTYYDHGTAAASNPNLWIISNGQITTIPEASISVLLLMGLPFFLVRKRY